MYLAVGGGSRAPLVRALRLSRSRATPLRRAKGRGASYIPRYSNSNEGVAIVLDEKESGGTAVQCGSLCRMNLEEGMACAGFELANTALVTRTLPNVTPALRVATRVGRIQDAHFHLPAPSTSTSTTTKFS